MEDNTETLVLNEVEIILEPERFRVLKILTKEKLGIIDLAGRLGKDKEEVVRYLSMLEQRGYIESKYQIIEKPQAGRKGTAHRVYWASDNIDKIAMSIQILLCKLRKGTPEIR